MITNPENSYVQLVSLKKNDVLFHQGDAPDFAYLVESGSLSVLSLQADQVVEIGVAEAGDLLGEIAVLDNLPRTATVKATSDCLLLQINSDQFIERIQNADPILRSLLTNLLKRYRIALYQQDKLNNTDTASHTKSSADSAPRTLLEQLSLKKVRLEAQLKEALFAGNLDVYYQPLLEIATNQIVGYEALIRWQHAEHGFISPVEFIKLAEETSLIQQVGEYVIDSACKAVKQLIQQGASPSPFIAVNISPNQLTHSGLVERIVERVEKDNLPRGSLKIELTESQSLVTDDVKYVMALCRKHGIRVALDDFGTGYSNLTQLHELEFDTIKIDQAFVRSAQDNPRSMILVNTILNMCHLLGADALVEGVENQQILDTLHAAGCRYAQGYYIGKPQTLDDIITNMIKKS